MNIYELAERLNPQLPIVNGGDPLINEDADLAEIMLRKLAQPPKD